MRRIAKARAGLVALLTIAAFGIRAAAQCRGPAAWRAGLMVPLSRLGLNRSGAGGSGTVPEKITAIVLSLPPGDYLLAGVELRSRSASSTGKLEGPSVRLAGLPPRPTALDAVAALMGSLPDYSCRVVGPHLINIRPRQAASDAADPLNARITVRQKPADLLGLFWHPWFYLPQIPAPNPRARYCCEILGGGPDEIINANEEPLISIFNRLTLDNAAASLEEQRKRGWRAPRYLYGWLCIEDGIPRGGRFRSTNWGSLSLWGPPPPPPAHGKRAAPVSNGRTAPD